MKILLYNNTQLAVKNGRYYCASGTGRFAQELVGLGNDVTMFGQQIEDLTSTSSFDILNAGIKVVGLKRFKSKILSYLLLYCYSVKYIIRSDFVYFFYPTSYRYLPLVCLMFCKKYGLYVRGTIGIDNGFSRYLYRKAYVVYTVASFFTNIVNESSGRKNGHTIRPMITYTISDVFLNRKYHFKEKYEILYLGRIEKDKGIEELLLAINNLIKKGIDNIHLRVVGGGGYLEAVRERIETLNIGKYVSIEGSVSDEEKKNDYYKHSDLYVLPTYHEGFPRTLYEAMIFGTPIITTFVGGIPSLMVDMQNCKMIEVRSVKSIEDNIMFAIEHYDLMCEYAKNATQTVLKVLDPSRLSHAQDLYEAIRGITK